MCQSLYITRVDGGDLSKVTHPRNLVNLWSGSESVTREAAQMLGRIAGDILKYNKTEHNWEIK
jgi:hypothetical protein